MALLRPVMGSFERSFQKKAFKELQQALILAGIRVILKEPDWGHPKEWTPRDKTLVSALTSIGMLYYEQVPR